MNNFVIGSGRCGSTLLDSLLAEHPQVQVISNFFAALDFVNRFREGEVSGGELVEMFSCQNEIGNLWVERDMKIKEANPVARMPALFSSVLHPIVKGRDPRPIFAEIIDWAGRRPTVPLADHYAAFFEWLMKRFGKTHWIERSGGSLLFFSGMQRMFPEARYVHIHRDGPESALSMMEHTHFTEVVSFYHDPPSHEELVRAARNDEPRDSDPIMQRFRYRPTPAQFGEYLSYMMVRAYHVMTRLDRRQLMDVRFEDLLARPEYTLQRIADFFGLPEDPHWMERAAKKIQRKVPTRADKLPPAQYAALKKACLPGEILVGRELGESPVIEAARDLRSIYARLDKEARDVG